MEDRIRELNQKLHERSRQRNNLTHRTANKVLVVDPSETKSKEWSGPIKPTFVNDGGVYIGGNSGYPGSVSNPQYGGYQCSPDRSLINATVCSDVVM